MGEPLWIQEKNPEEGNWSMGYLCFPRGGPRHTFILLVILLCRFKNFCSPPLLRLAPLDSRFPHGRAILSTSRNSQYT